MAIPTRKEIRMDVFNALSDGEWHHHDDVCDTVADVYGVTDEERQQAYKNGNKIFSHRVAGARGDLVHLHLIDYDRERGEKFFRLSERGQQVRNAAPDNLDRQTIENLTGELPW